MFSWRNKKNVSTFDDDCDGVGACCVYSRLGNVLFFYFCLLFPKSLRHIHITLDRILFLYPATR